MERRDFGNNGLKVSALGLGTGRIGDPALDDAAAARLLNEALDLGLNLIDSAPSYGVAEDRIGRYLAHRRSEFVLSTKVGYGIPGCADWTFDAVALGIDAALQRLHTDVIDIVHLHSCSLAALQAGAVIDALARAREQGKIRVAAYSGENDELAWALASGRFGAVECSVNVFDQRSLNDLLPGAAAAGIGVIAKRAVGNAPWRFAQQPVGDYCEAYWQRLQALAYDRSGLEWDEFALRFSVHAPAVSNAIVGTSSIEHLRHNVKLAANGPLPAALLASITHRFLAIGSGWRGEI